ncbi:MAG: MFS transporter [Deltaproteobacteria bacterium]
MSHFSKVLKNRDFFLLWTGQIISQLGDRLTQMALLGLVYQRAPGSAVEIAKVLAFTIFPVFLVGPIAGAYVDRWDRRKVMYVCDFLRAGLVVLIPLFLLTKGFIWIYLIIFLSFSIGRFFVPAKLSILPELVDKKSLLTANSLINTTGMIAAVLGFGISGLIVELMGAKSGFYLDALSFLISATSIFLISSRSKREANVEDLKSLGRDLVQGIQKSVLTDIKEGVLYFVRHREIRFIAAIIFLLWSALGSVYVISIVFVQNTLHSATKDLGFLIVFLGLGLFLGSMAYGAVGHKLSQFKIIFYSLILSGFMLAIFAFVLNAYPVFACAAALALLLGLSVSPIMIASNTIIHKVSDNAMMGKIFSSLEIVIHLGFLIFMFASGFLANHIPQSAILVCIGILIAITGALSLLFGRYYEWIGGGKQV